MDYSSHKKNIILVFDVETTGLIPKKSQNSSIIPTTMDQYPYIIQLSFVLYDTDNKEVIKCYDSFIDIPDSTEITPFISNMTGIYKEKCKNGGKNIVDVLIEFERAYKQCGSVIAHNIDFDINMIQVEIERNRLEIIRRAPQCFTLFQPMYERIHNIERYCTMRKGTNMCNIIIPSITEGKPPRKKFPKLGELYSHLFNGEKAEGLHNSLVDIMVCLKCYLKMK